MDALEVEYSIMRRLLGEEKKPVKVETKIDECRTP
tara:strand:+ start:349 stop:453 length:105 start_codon:yes stop_codon:yes gene_type:complete